MAGKPVALDPAERIDEIEIALARPEVSLVAVAKAIRQPDLLDAREIERFDKSGDVMYLMDSRGRDTGALFAWNLTTDDKQLIAANPLCDVGGIMMHPTENTIQGVSFTYLRTEWEFKDKEVAEDYKYLKTVADGEWLRLDDIEVPADAPAPFAGVLIEVK